MRLYELPDIQTNMFRLRRTAAFLFSGSGDLWGGLGFGGDFMRTAEEVHYELLEVLQEFKQHIGEGSFDKPEGLEKPLSDAWDKADELEKILNSGEFEEFLP